MNTPRKKPRIRPRKTVHAEQKVKRTVNNREYAEKKICEYTKYRALNVEAEAGHIL